MKPEFLQPAAVAAECGVSRRTVHRRMRDDPDFPKPIRLTARMLLFKRSELDAYFELKRQTQPTGEQSDVRIRKKTINH